MGYQKIQIKKGFNLVGVQFLPVGSDALSRSIAGVGSLDASFAGYDFGYAYATEMQVWDPIGKGYTNYGWSGTSGTDVDGDPSYDNQWLDSGTMPTEDEIDLSAGVWINAEKDGVLTVAGEVAKLTDKLTVELSEGFNIVANPYPCAVPVKDFGKLDSSFAGYDFGYAYATELQVWDPETKGYTNYGWSGTSGTDVDGDPSYDNQWLDSGTMPTEDVIPMGAAVWIKAEKSGTISFDPL